MNTSVFNKNNLKTVALLSSLAGALVVFGGAFGGRAGASIGLLIGLAMVGSSYWFSDKLAVRAAGAAELPVGELPNLRADLEAMASRAGITTPRLFISPSMQPTRLQQDETKSMPSFV